MGKGFAARVFAPKGAQPEPPRLPRKVLSQLTMKFRRELLQSKRDQVHILLEHANHDPLAVVIDRIGDTACLATWIKNAVIKSRKVTTGGLEAVSLVLTGIDKSADAEAISRVEHWTDQAGKKLKSAARFAEEARKELRPILLILCQSKTINVDPLFLSSAEMLAQAFLDQFGVEGDKAAFDKTS